MQQQQHQAPTHLALSTQSPGQPKSHDGTLVASPAAVDATPSPSRQPQIDLEQLVDPATLTTRSSVLHALNQLSDYSAHLQDELESLIQDSQPIIHDAHQDIVALGPRISQVREQAAVLDSHLQDSARVALRISERVRLLDEERKRIALATQWAVSVSNLKSSLQLLAAAIQARDWDQATAHCVAAMQIDPEIITSKVAAVLVPSTDLPEPPEVTLLTLRQTLLQVFTQSFTDATESKNETEATRFFKLFPKIGWKKEGLDVYSSFAKSMVRDKGRTITEGLGSGKAQSPMHFAALLTTLFEHLAMLIDMHQPMVDRHYGTGNFGHGVMPGLQEECDRLGVRILDAWREDRGVRRKLEDVRSYRFTGIIAIKTQPQAFKASFGVPSRMASPAGGRTANSSIDEPSGPDGREIDRILTELAAISSRWGLYRRFLRGRLHRELQSDAQRRQKALEEEREAQASEPLKDFRRTSMSTHRASTENAEPEHAGAEGQEISEDLRDIAQESLLGKRTSEAMLDMYVPMETWYLRNSLEKAFRIDQPDLAARPYTSSILDDAFYVLRTVMTRILSTSSLKVVSDMFKMVRTVVEEDYIEVLVGKMENVWRSVSGSMTVDGPRKEAATREMRIVFATYLNVLDVSAQYMDRILLDVGNEQVLSRLFDDDELEQVLAIVSSLGSLVNRFQSGLRTELDQLFAQVTRPRLRSILTESYRDVSYFLDEDSYAEAEYKDLVRRRFIKGWEHVLSAFKGIFTDRNQDTYVGMALDALLRPWEGMVLGMRFSELGALRFDKDVRSITTFLSSQSSLPVRDKFTRLQQISYVLNLDTNEDEGDIYQNAVASGISWRLSSAEVKSVRALRV